MLNWFLVEFSYLLEAGQQQQILPGNPRVRALVEVFVYG